MMKQKKRIFGFLVAISLFISLIGCGGSDIPTETPRQETQTEVSAAENQPEVSAAENQPETPAAETQTADTDTTGTYRIENLVGTPSDYSDENNWMNIPEITKEVDTFYIYPTVYIDSSEDAPDIVPIDDELMRTNAQGMFASQASVYEESTNVFAPYYRQSNLMAIADLRGDDLEQFQMQEQRTDIYAALDYYFENYNDGRPFILAGHSQGSILSKIVLGDYMQAHPDYYERMVAAYPLGFSITKEWLEEHPYAKFAEGENDTGVIISWNTEAPGNKGQDNIVVEEGALSINPLNWKLDGTYAGVEENLGSLVLNEETNEYEVVDGLGDAQIDTERGVVICTTNRDFVSFPELFGSESLHSSDYSLYYANIQKNVADRIANYMKNN